MQKQVRTCLCGDTVLHTACHCPSSTSVRANQSQSIPTEKKINTLSHFGFSFFLCKLLQPTHLRPQQLFSGIVASRCFRCEDNKVLGSLRAAEDNFLRGTSASTCPLNGLSSDSSSSLSSSGILSQCSFCPSPLQSGFILINIGYQACSRLTAPLSNNKLIFFSSFFLKKENRKGDKKACSITSALSALI